MAKKKKKTGLWSNIWAKRKAGKKMRAKGSKGAPTQKAFNKAKARSKKKKGKKKRK